MNDAEINKCSHFIFDTVKHLYMYYFAEGETMWFCKSEDSTFKAKSTPLIILAYTRKYLI